MNEQTVVIMAAGKGTRLLPLTKTRPKPLIRVMGRTSLEYNLDNLVEHINEIVIVVGYQKEKIRDYFGDEYKGIKIKYAVQKDPLGTAHALHVSKEAVSNEKMLVMNGDDLYDSELVKLGLEAKGNVIVGKKVERWQKYGVLKTDRRKNLKSIVEKPKKFVGDVANIGFYKVNKNIYEYFDKIKQSVRGEYEITDMLTLFAQDHKVKVKSCDSGWTPLSHPWDLLDDAKKNSQYLDANVEGEIEDGAVINGKISLGKNSIIKKGAYLDGDFYIGRNCKIGPNCLLRGFGSFDDGVEIGNGVEITRSIVGKQSKIKHLSYIGDSVIGEDVNIGAGTIVSNLRHDDSNIKLNVKGKLIDTKRRKFGVVLGDSVKTGINTSFYPGTSLDPGITTRPGAIVRYKIDPELKNNKKKD